MLHEMTHLANAKRLVVKVGSALVTNNGAGLDLDAINDWARQIGALRKQGKEVVLVSSGAIALRHAASGLDQATEIGS
jgi:glutamate 5-kinase